MRFYIALLMFVFFIFSLTSVDFVMAQTDPVDDIVFLQTGILDTTENKFQISNDITIRSFFNGNIIRVSGITVEGFPYITYSKISDENIDTHGMIFVNNKFMKLSFIEKINEIEESEDKKDDISLAVQYTQRAHSKQFIFIDVKIFDKKQNKYDQFNQNYGYISNTNIEVAITDSDKNEVFSSNGITNDKGLFETKYLIPDNSKRETLTITINAENEKSSSSKILQAFALGNIPTNGGP